MGTNRTYSLPDEVIEWIEEFADENDADYSEVVARCVKVYAAKTARDEWNDPKFTDQIDQRFGKL